MLKKTFLQKIKAEIFISLSISLLYVILPLKVCSQEHLTIPDNAKIFEQVTQDKMLVGYDLSVNNFSDSVFKDIIFKNVLFKNTTIDKTIFENCEFHNCVFDYSSLFVNGVRFSKCKFKNDSIYELSLNDADFAGLSFENCYIENLDFQRAYIEHIIFDNCKIGFLKLTESTIDDFLIAHSKIDIIKVVNSNSLHLKFGKDVGIDSLCLTGGIHKEIIFQGTNEYGAIYLSNSELINPGISPKIITNTDFTKCIFHPDERSMLQIEFEADKMNTASSQNTKRVKVKQKYLDARLCYITLANQFNEAKYTRISNYFNYRANAVDRKKKYSGISHGAQYLYNEMLRGKYGTDPITVLISALWLIIVFAIIYFILGLLNIGWGIKTYTSLLGDNLEDRTPQVLVWKRGDNLFYYFMECFFFSTSQLLLGGISKDFHIYNFSVNILSPPRKYAALSWVRWIAGIENILGLIMLFFFINAFVNGF